MIIDFVAIKLNTPDLFFNKKYNSSGVKAEDKAIYKYAYPSSEYPVLILPNKIFDNTDNYIENGYYTLALSEDKKFLLLIQSCTLKAKIPVTKIEETPQTQEEIDEEKQLVSKMEEYRLKRKFKKFKEAEKKINDLKRRKQTLMSADIFDSGMGYYILKYTNQNIKAWGYIIK